MNLKKKIQILFNQYNFGNVAKSLINQATNISFGIESSFRNYQQVKYDILYDYEMCVICSKEVASFDSLVFDVSIGEGIAIVSSDAVREGEVKVIPLKNSHHHSQYVIAYLDKPVQNLINSIFNYFNLYNK